MVEISRSVCLLALCSLAMGCGALAPRDALRLDSIEQALQSLESGLRQTATIENEPAPQAADVAMPEVEVPLEAPRFDLSCSEAPVRSFLRSLVKDTNYNIVVHPDVKGTVSLELTQVTLTDVMNVIREVYGLDYVLEGNVYRVYPDTLRTEIFRLNYLNIARSGRSEVQVSAGKVTDSNGQNRGDAYGTDYGGGSSQQEDVVGTVVNTEAEADLWSEVRTTLEALTAFDEGSHVMVTPQVGVIVVRAKPVTLRAVQSYIAQVESSVNRQVILEAKVVEVTLNDGFESGIDWNTFGRGSGGLRANSRHSFAGELMSGESDFYNPRGSVFTLSGDVGDFSGTLNLLKTQGTVQVLSSPRIATVNNQKAVIKVGSDEFFVTDINSNTITAGSAINTNDSPELTPFFSGIALDVTPQISDDGNVVLHVHPTVSEVSEQLKEIGGEMVPLAASTIRESDSIVRASSGQIVVIGGLMQNTSQDENAGVPWLRRIPLIGHLFNQKSQRSRKSELVILLKPVVVENGTQAAFISQSTSTVRQLRDQLK